MIKKICKLCGKEFFTKNLKRVCCSTECSIQNVAQHTQKSKLDREEICIQCGKTFPTKWAKICPECRYQNKKTRMIIGRRDKNPTYQCRQCEKVFSYDTKLCKPLYCPVCIKYPVRKIYHIQCAICNKGFIVKLPNEKTCSDECSLLLLKKSNKKRQRKYRDRKNGRI